MKETSGLFTGPVSLADGSRSHSTLNPVARDGASREGVMQPCDTLAGVWLTGADAGSRQDLGFRAPTTRVWCGTAILYISPGCADPSWGRTAQRLILVAVLMDTAALFTRPGGCVEGYRHHSAQILLRVTLFTGGDNQP